MCAHVVRAGQPHAARPALNSTVHVWPALDREGTSYLPGPTRSVRRPASLAFATAVITLCAFLSRSTFVTSRLKGLRSYVPLKYVGLGTYVVLRGSSRHTHTGRPART